MTTLDSDVVHTLPADTMTTLDSDVIHTLPADTMTTLDSDAVHTLPVEKCHLEGSRLFNLQNLYNAIKTISEHSVKCGAVVELVGEVHTTEWTGFKTANHLLQM